MWIFIIILLIVIILISVVKNDNKQNQINHLQNGGLRKSYPLFTKYLETVYDMSFVEDKGNSFLYSKIFFNNGRQDSLQIGIKLNTAKESILYSSYTNSDGFKYEGFEVNFYNNIEHFEICIEASLEKLKSFDIMLDLKKKINVERDTLDETPNEKLTKFLNDTIENARVDKYDIREPMEILVDVALQLELDDERKKHIETIARYTKLIEQDSKDKEAYLIRGLFKEILKDYSGAILDYKKAIEIDPQDSEGHECIDSLNLKTKEDQEFLDYIEIERSPLFVKYEQSTKIIDIDGNEYKTIKIGQQIWMAENLKVTRFQNGDIIPLIENENEWKDTNNPAFCYYNNNLSFNSNFGALYNWYAVNDNRNIAPKGWHVATSIDWMILINSLKGKNVAGGKLKESGSAHWIENNEYATNDIGFSALPGGYRFETGEFSSMFESGEFWSSTQINSSKARSRHIHSIGRSIESISLDHRNGLSVRCVKDSDGSPIPIKTRSLKEFSKEIGVPNLSVFRSKNNTLYLADINTPNIFIAHVSEFITCKDDVKNPTISTFLDNKGIQYHVLHDT